jgi:hypothetical protein
MENCLNALSLSSGGNSLFPVGGGGAKHPKFPTKLSSFRQTPLFALEKAVFSRLLGQTKTSATVPQKSGFNSAPEILSKCWHISHSANWGGILKSNFALPEIWDKMATDMRTLTKYGDQILL